MPVWVVQIADGGDERVEAGMLLVDSGALVALAEECVLVRAWAPGQWRTVRHINGADDHPEGDAANRKSNVLVGLPRG